MAAAAAAAVAVVVVLHLLGIRACRGFFAYRWFFLHSTESF